jgi:hypothetical protein
VTDLERRRRAIADALRAVMAEPLPLPQPLPAAQPEPALEIPTQSAAPVDPDDEWNPAELTETGEVIVPPLEAIGSMSRKASLALFGHA